MRLVHDPEGDSRVLADDVDIAEGFVQTSKGLMFQSSIPDGYALVFEFDPPATWMQRLPLVREDAVAWRFIHMLFVRMPIDVLWLQGETVAKVETLSPWVGVGLARADRIVELPAGAADSVSVGDTVRVTE